MEIDEVFNRIENVLLLQTSLLKQNNISANILLAENGTYMFQLYGFILSDQVIKITEINLLKHSSEKYYNMLKNSLGTNFKYNSVDNNVNIDSFYNKQKLDSFINTIKNKVKQTDTTIKSVIEVKDSFFTIEGESLDNEMIYYIRIDYTAIPNYEKSKRFTILRAYYIFMDTVKEVDPEVFEYEPKKVVNYLKESGFLSP